ncbi:Cytochrome c3 [Ferrimonas sediminum]|uniref:Cytochrome c3 n=1 Tax=Ferrimonas sediminum TaxID=718193 RepID=A0A1G8UC30_9GAMM|nr:cytochrome c3 family protein [Ferrimonas sediminum]SDJ51396.1 Cytochrome c3 [Ferrimonas sediminum]
MKNALIYSMSALSLCVTSLAVTAESTLKEYDQMTGRSYHEQLHSKNNCKACHGSEVSGYPADNTCHKCHNPDKLAQKTVRSGDEVHQNPHDNLHYGKDVPCTECHGEHIEKQPLCADCHTFKYPNHKK